MSHLFTEPKSIRQMPWELDAEHAARTIGDHQGLVLSIWSRNMMVSSPRSMIEMITIWYGYLSEAARGAPRAAFSREFAMLGLGTTIHALASQMRVELSEVMAVKYPGKCFYCGCAHGCSCSGESKRRPDKLFSTPRPDLVALPIVTWQERLREMYGEGNRTHGVDFVMRRFVEEHAELLRAVLMGQPSPICEELADVFAWWVALANIFELDAGKLLMNPLSRPNLPDACFACTLTPCMRGPNCPIF